MFRSLSTVSVILSTALVLFFCRSAFSFSLEDCVGEGGGYYCSAPTATPWKYGLCDEAAAYVYRFKAWCAASGGTFVSAPTGGYGCSGDSPDAESNLVSRSEDFARRVSKKDICTAVDSGWGASIDPYQCWQGEPAYKNGLLVRDFRHLNISSCGEQIFARRDRGLVCPPETKRYTIGERVVCASEEEFDECSAVGNPVLALTGKKIQRETDFSSKIPFVRIYSSSPKFLPFNLVGELPVNRGVFGDYWGTNFSYRLFDLEGNHSAYALTFPNGAVEYFSSDLEPVTTQQPLGDLRRSGDDFVYQMKGLKLVFSESGYLKQYIQGAAEYTLEYSGADAAEPLYAVLPNGQPSELPLPEGLLLNIVDHNGRSVYRISYDAGGRAIVATHRDKSLLYEYDANNNLSKVTQDGQLRREYQYGYSKFKHALTGLVDESGELFASWSYDASGRATSSAHANRSERFELDFSSANGAENRSITVTNPLLKKTTYYFERIRGIRKTTRVEGHESPNCAAANKSYAYYDNGTLKSKTDWEGNVTTYLRDDWGREISRTEAAGTPDARTITTEYHSEFSKPIKITEPGLVTEMTYDGSARLLNITRSEGLD